MDYSRIAPAIDVDTLEGKHVTLIGGSYGTAVDLARCGVGAMTYVDFARTAERHPPRQDLNTSDIGRLKIEGLAGTLGRIRPDLDFEPLALDICSLSLQQFDEHFGHTDCFVFATDSIVAQARGCQEATRMGKPAIWIGIYAGAGAGEIILWRPGSDFACYRCICKSRYEAFRQGQRDAPSAGGVIFDLHLLDSIAGQLVIAILTAGSENRFGRMLDQLGPRNLFQVRLQPDYHLGDPDRFEAYLGNHSTHFCWTTIAQAPSRDPHCPDCSSTVEVAR